MIDSYGIYYSFNKDRESLLILFDNKEVTYSKCFGNVEVSFHDLDPISYRIRDIDKIIKIHAEGLLPTNNKELLSIINNVLSKEGLETLKVKEHSDFYNAIITNVNPIAAKTIDGCYTVNEKVKVNINDHVVLVKRGSFYFNQERLKVNHLCTNKELGVSDDDNVYIDPELNIEEDFYITK